MENKMRFKTIIGIFTANLFAMLSVIIPYHMNGYNFLVFIHIGLSYWLNRRMVTTGKFIRYSIIIIIFIILSLLPVFFINHNKKTIYSYVVGAIGTQALVIIPLCIVTIISNLIDKKIDPSTNYGLKKLREKYLEAKNNSKVNYNLYNNKYIKTIYKKHN